MLLSAKERKDIGLEYVLDKLQIMTPYGEKRKNERRLYRPGEKELLQEELEAVLLFYHQKESRAYALHDLEYEFCRVKDIQASVERAKRGATLDEVELFEMKVFSRVIGELLRKLKEIEVPQGFKLYSLETLEKRLDPEGTGILTFYIYDAYSEELTRIRKEKRELEERIYQTKEEERAPLFEQRAELVVQEEEEERKIRKELSRDVEEEADELLHNMDAIAKLDHWIAKAKLAMAYGGVMPTLLHESEIHLVEASSPMMEDYLREELASFQKLDIDLCPGTTVVTGANMGGKSVSLKTVLLNVMLVHLGMLPFAKEARLGLFDFVFYLGDDFEDVKAGLSSFGAEILRLREVLKRTKNEVGLLVLDEPARGTNPREGRAIVKGLSQHFMGEKSVLLLATHFDQILEPGMVHYQIRGFEGVDFEALKSQLLFEEKKSLETIRAQMDYRLEPVLEEREVPKDALHICTLLGLDEELIQTISQLL